MALATGPNDDDDDDDDEEEEEEEEEEEDVTYPLDEPLSKCV